MLTLCKQIHGVACKHHDVHCDYFHRGSYVEALALFYFNVSASSSSNVHEKGSFFLKVTMKYFVWLGAGLRCDLTTMRSCSASTQRLRLCPTMLGVAERRRGAVSVKHTSVTVCLLPSGE